MTYLAIFAGFGIGFVLGVLVMSLMFASSDADRDIDALRHWRE